MDRTAGRGRSPALALGLRLALISAEEGGRRSPLVDTSDGEWAYRPNWGLPSMTPPEQTGAPVLGFSTSEVAPGGTACAVVITVFPDLVEQWRREAVTGVVLSMYEGNRVCGHGTVLWRTDIDLPMSAETEAGFRRWLKDPGAELRQVP